MALSVVGTDRLAASEGGYFKAKAAQENLIRESGKPYTIAHSTQFFEFVKSIADSATVGRVVRLSRALVQPIAGDDVVADPLARYFGTALDERELMPEFTATLAQR